jgi:hypothetical protein
MCQQFWGKAGSGQFYKDDLDARLATMLRGWYAIRVSRNQDYAVHTPVLAQCCDVQTDSHVYALLFEIWFEIAVCQRSRRRYGDALGLEPAKLQDSAPNRK